MKKLIIILIISIILSGCHSNPPEPNGVAYRTFAVGVGDYLFSEADLQSPAPNTERLKERFSQCKFGEEEIEFEVIETLVNYSATEENILNGILSVFGEADENDVSYFYYMGHGGVASGIPIITGTDSKFTLETSITVHELEEHLSMIPGTKIVFLETCHGGNFINRSEGNFDDMVISIFAQRSKDLINKEGYQILTCGRGDQYCWEVGDWSYFCKYLIAGCDSLNADTNEDEIVDLTELHKYINKRVCSCKQTAQIYPEGSTFPIVEY